MFLDLRYSNRALALMSFFVTNIKFDWEGYTVKPLFLNISETLSLVYDIFNSILLKYSSSLTAAEPHSMATESRVYEL